MRPIKPPDFQNAQIFDDNPILNLIYNPKTDELEPILFSEKYKEKNWCGCITRYRNGDGCYHVYDFFHKGPVITSWYLLNDPDSKTACAVCLNGQWYLLEKDEECVMVGDKESYSTFKEMLSMVIVFIKKGEDPKIILRINKR